MYNNNNNHNSRQHQNGSRRSMQSPFGDDNYQEFSSPFADDNLEEVSEQRSQQPLTQQGKENLRLLQRFYLSLIVTGIVVGGILTLGVALLLDQWGVLDSPNDKYREENEPKNIIFKGINRQFNSKFFFNSNGSN